MVFPETRISRRLITVCGSGCREDRCCDCDCEVALEAEAAFGWRLRCDECEDAEDDVDDGIAAAAVPAAARNYHNGFDAF